MPTSDSIAMTLGMSFAQDAGPGWEHVSLCQQDAATQVPRLCEHTAQSLGFCVSHLLRHTCQSGLSALLPGPGVRRSRCGRSGWEGSSEPGHVPCISVLTRMHSTFHPHGTVPSGDPGLPWWLWTASRLMYTCRRLSHKPCLQADEQFQPHVWCGF